MWPMHRAILLISICLGIVGCIQVPPTVKPTALCSDILPADLEMLPPLPAAEAKTAVARVVGALDPAGTALRSTDETGWDGRSYSALTWETQSQTYRLDVYDEGSSVLRIGFGRNGPTVNQLIACFGAPDSYIAWLGPQPASGPYGIVLMLFYPERGAIFSMQSSTFVESLSDPASRLRLDISQQRIEVLRMVEPQGIEALLDEYLRTDLGMDPVGEDAEIWAWYEAVRKPWSKASDALEISLIPYPGAQ